MEEDNGRFKAEWSRIGGQSVAYDYMIYGGILGTAIFFTLSLILFFKLNIRKAIGDITGISVKHGIKQIKYNSQQNTLLRNSQYRKRDQILVKLAGDTLSLKEEEASIQDTMVLSEESEDTVILCDDLYPETTVLTEEPIDCTENLKEQSHSGKIPDRGFDLITNVVMYHTDEVIEEQEALEK